MRHCVCPRTWGFSHCHGHVPSYSYQSCLFFCCINPLPPLDTELKDWALPYLLPQCWSALCTDHSQVSKSTPTIILTITMAVLQPCWSLKRKHVYGDTKGDPLSQKRGCFHLNLRQAHFWGRKQNAQPISITGNLVSKTGGTRNMHIVHLDFLLCNAKISTRGIKINQ